MATVKIPLGAPTNKNANPVELDVGMQELVNGYLGVADSGMRAIKRRPGLAQALNVPGTWYGGFYWPIRNAVYFAGGGRLLEVTEVNGSLVATQYSDSNTGNLSGESPPTFAIGRYLDGRQILVVTNGYRAVTLTATGVTGVINDPDASARASHVAAIDGYILLNDLQSGKIRWCDVNNPLVFGGLNFAEAEGSPDFTIAVHVKNREIFFIGTDTVEIWENDGQSPFSRVPGGMIEIGCLAPYSIIVREDGLYWLDKQRRVIQFNGREANPISSNYDREFEKLSFVEDCIAHDVKIGGTTFFIYNFPRAKKTFAYNLDSKEWNEWAEWVPQLGSYVGFRGRGYAYLPTANLHLVPSGGASIFRMSPDAGRDDAADIRVLVRTGFVSHKTTRSKRSNEVRFTLERGTTTSTTEEPQLVVRWRNDNKRWSNEHTVGLGLVGDTSMIGRLRKTGIYARRQWELCLTNQASVVLGDAEEEIDYLSR